ncbi:MAG: hypothetical protein AABW79_01005 [Nanoarchaeota archaeon]
MKNLAPDITRKRMLIEGFYDIQVNESVIKEFFTHLTNELSLRTYAQPIIHTATGQGSEANSGYDCFVPLIDSGIYIGIWTKQKFISLVLYTCKYFDEEKANEITKKFWKIKETATHSF